MELSINTAALFFPAITLIMLAYTNRFLGLSNRVRMLHEKYQQIEQRQIIFQQIKNLRYRIKLIRNMQTYGVTSLLLSIVSMFFIFIQQQEWAKLLFAISLLSFTISLVLSFIEIRLSTKAIELEVSDMDELENPSAMKTPPKKLKREEEIHNDTRQ